MKKIMKRVLKVFLALLGAILWLLDFDNILWFILIPGGILVWGMIEGYSWSYYLIAYGIYAVINFGVHLLGKSVDRHMDKRIDEQLDKK